MRPDDLDAPRETVLMTLDRWRRPRHAVPIYSPAYLTCVNPQLNMYAVGVIDIDGCAVLSFDRAPKDFHLSLL